MYNFFLKSKLLKFLYIGYNNNKHNIKRVNVVIWEISSNLAHARVSKTCKQRKAFSIRKSKQNLSWLFILSIWVMNLILPPSQALSWWELIFTITKTTFFNTNSVHAQYFLCSSLSYFACLRAKIILSRKFP